MTMTLTTESLDFAGSPVAGGTQRLGRGRRGLKGRS